jgi:hypothetical protein
MADIAPAELDFEGGDRRRGRGHRASAPRSAPERAAARPPHREMRGDDSRPRRERTAPAERRPAERRPAVPRRDSGEPAVALFAQPAAEPAAGPRNSAQPERRVVGFGDDLPAFLARAPRVAARA